MSLLDNHWNAEVELFPEELVYDRDGNPRTQASDTPIKIKVLLQPLNQSGTAARRAEQDNEGFETEKVMRMRPAGKHRFIVIGAQAKVRWNGEWWSLFGDRTQYFSSPRTAHYDYTLRRS